MNMRGARALKPQYAFNLLVGYIGVAQQDHVVVDCLKHRIPRSRRSQLEVQCMRCNRNALSLCLGAVMAISLWSNWKFNAISMYLNASQTTSNYQDRQMINRLTTWGYFTLGRDGTGIWLTSRVVRMSARASFGEFLGLCNFMTMFLYFNWCWWGFYTKNIVQK